MKALFCQIAMCVFAISLQAQTINGHEYVDLGLSVCWATCNVGASSPEDYGGYYAWGETFPKENYTEENCATYGKGLSHIEGDPKYDVATANWGGTWRMPTREDMNELFDKCQREWVTQDGRNGLKVTGPNGNSIFLPAAGVKDEGLTDGAEEYGLYWAATPQKEAFYSHNLTFNENRSIRMPTPRYKGGSVRPVIKSPESYVTETSDEYKNIIVASSGTNNGHDYVDLGLRVNWATCNVGAESPTDNGDYFAWSEIEPKEVYTIAGKRENYGTGYPPRIASSPKYDAATANWGGTWRMPTMDEIDELLRKCKREWITINGCNGLKLTAPNGNCIFLPAAGKDGKRNNEVDGEKGFYWSSTLEENLQSNSTDYAYCFTFNSLSDGRAWYMPYSGMSVRPVFLASNETMGTVNGHEFVDLGLSVKWATCNLGASSPTEKGDCLAWGENKVKSSYTSDNSKTYGKKLRNIAGDPLYDAAMANWGAPWRMPTRREVQELLRRCRWHLISQGIPKYFEVTGPNGNSIFLPCTTYWTSTPTGERYADYLEFGDIFSPETDVYSQERYKGSYVRPIIEF